MKKLISDFILPKACLGTMSFGAHVDESTAWEIMDRAFERGCRFFDTAEMYPVPFFSDTTGETERIIGRWMKERNNRKSITLATKVVGNERGISWIRGGNTKLNTKHIETAIEGSLQRLQTDYIDLYYLHWPDRIVNKFGERNFIAPKNEEQTPIEETLQVLQQLQKKGVIKNIAVSNETPWGMMEYIRLAKENNYPIPVGIQNNYSLLTRSYETSLSEISYRENIKLLAYSPLGYGALVSTKRSEGRFETYPTFVGRYQSPEIQIIVKEYKTLAEKNSITIEELALSFIASQPFVGSIIIGPATGDQLDTCLDACSKKLSPEILFEIEKIHEKYPNICA